MDVVKHRINKIADLDTLNPAWGIEVDIRSQLHPKKTLHLAHDPWDAGDEFDAWLARVKELGIRGPLIINTKEDGLEARCLELLAAHGLNNFFFLDTTIPTLVKWAVHGTEARFAARLSAYEPASFVQQFIGRVQWLWVDCFAGVPVAPEELAPFQGRCKICLVSPELQLGMVPNLAERIAQFGALQRLADAVCTKVPAMWTAARP